MHSDGTQGETARSQPLPGYPISDRTRISRRQALGRISAVAGAGAAAWVVPEIFIAKPAAGTALSGPSTSGGGGGPPGGGGGPPGSGSSPPGSGSSPPGSSGSPPGSSGSPPGSSGSPPGGGGGSTSSAPITDVTTTNGPGGTGTPSKVVTSAVTTTPPVKSLAFTGLNLQRDAEIGAALIAGGWAMKYWASRIEEERPTS